LDANLIANCTVNEGMEVRRKSYMKYNVYWLRLRLRLGHRYRYRYQAHNDKDHLICNNNPCSTVPVESTINSEWIKPLTCIHSGFDLSPMS
jgi:hypothetical protein